MPDDTKPNFDVRVKFKGGQTPSIKIQDASGNAIGKLDVSADSTITFSAANGSDPFYFVGFYAQTTPITTCPAPNSSPPNPPAFQNVTLEPMSAPSQMVVEDTDAGVPAGGSITYHYAVQIRTQDPTPTYYWSDPEIVNHAEQMPEIPAVRLPDDMPDIGRSVGPSPAQVTSSAPPPA